MATFGVNYFGNANQQSSATLKSNASEMVNSTEMSTKMQDFKQVLKGANDVVQMLKGFQQGKTWFDKAKPIISAIMSS